MKSAMMVVKSECGLHARPASQLVSASLKFKSSISVKRNEKMANCKSITSILSIGATQGDEIELLVEGEDEIEAFAAIAELLDKQ